MSTSAEFHRHFSLGPQIGSGACSVVHSCVRRATREVFAVKICCKATLSPQHVADVGREVALLRHLHHPQIVGFEAAYDGPEALLLVLEYLGGGPLFDVVARPFLYPEALAAVLVRHLAEALDYLHRNGIAHCDFKTENVLLKRPVPTDLQQLAEDPLLLVDVRVADFEYARRVGGHDSLLDCHGTPGYMAPELVRCAYYDSQVPYGRPVDLWALGVLAFIVLTGTFPFPPKSDQLHALILAGHWQPPTKPALSPLALDLLRRLLAVDPHHRATASEVLEHPWVNAPKTALYSHAPSSPRQHLTRRPSGSLSEGAADTSSPPTSTRPPSSTRVKPLSVRTAPASVGHHPPPHPLPATRPATEPPTCSRSGTPTLLAACPSPKGSARKSPMPTKHSSSRPSTPTSHPLLSPRSRGGLKAPPGSHYPEKPGVKRSPDTLP